MHNKIKKSGTIILLAASLLGSFNLPAQKDNRFEVSKQLDIFNAIVKETEMFYVDSFDIEKSVRQGIDAMLGSLDPYTEYFPENEMETLKLITTGGEYGGIGSLIRQRGMKGGVMIDSPYEGLPAATSGLKPGDIILKVDTVDVSEAPSSKVSDLLKGTINTKVKLLIKRPFVDEPMEITVTRKKIVFNTVIYSGIFKDDIGYIYLKQFTDKSGQEVKDAVLDLKKKHNIKSLILDLRGNGGGVLESAVQILGLFVPKGSQVISTKGKIPQWDRVYRTTIEPIDTVMPLAVLINGNSASASEIVSGALQDMDRAVIIGQRSFGKGLVQTTRDLPYDGKLKVTYSKYYIPSGRCIQQMDYSHRREDGSVAAIPDSLTSIFHTANGREVRDGGGIRPDIEIKEEKTPSLMYYLAVDTVTFDFVTDLYYHKYNQIGALEQFNVTDEDFEAFKKYAKEKNFTYDRQTAKVLKNLQEIAEFEGYLDGDTTLIKELEAKFTPNLERDFDINKEAIKKMLTAEIVKRHYYERGEWQIHLRNDETMDKTFEVLKDNSQYSKILSGETKSSTGK